jgi:hypothetical protein
MAAAISSGRPIRFIGVIAVMVASSQVPDSMAVLRMSVLTAAGATPLMRMLSVAYSSAADLACLWR